MDLNGNVSISYLLESAGDAGLIVSGLIQSDGDGDRSRFGTVFNPPSERAVVQALRLSGRVPLLLKLVECPK